MNEEYKPITNLWKDFEGYRYFGTLKLSSKIKYDGDDFVPLWEWVNQLQQENKKLKDNWNKLKEYIKETKLEEFEKSYGKRYGKTFTQAEIILCNMILDKMQEIEGSE